MTILQIFNKYQKPGGEEASVLRVADTLGENHTVVRCYFDSKEWAERDGPMDKIRQALRMVCNPAAIRRVRGEIREHKPDLILLHNIFPICSAAMLFELVRGPIPVVQYIHNFRPFSVSGYCWGGGRLLPQGLEKNFFPEIMEAAWQESRVRTAWYAMILWGLHLTGTYRKISRWLAISEFMRDKFVQAGIAPERVETLRHSWNPSPQLREAPSDSGQSQQPPYILYLGRLSTAKGVDVLLKAWEMAGDEIGNATLIIGGEGPMEDTVLQATLANPRIEFRGHVTGEEKFELLQGARAVIAPSVWWEPLGIVVYEAYDHFKPVLVAASGGLTETVVHGETGLLHNPGDATALAKHIVSVVTDPLLARHLGEKAKDHLLKTTAPEDWRRRMEWVLHDVAGQGIPSFATHNTNPQSPISLSIYLADQNPMLGRSLGISRMTVVVTDELQKRGDMRIHGLASRSSIDTGIDGMCRVLPWETKTAFTRVLTDHFHPLFQLGVQPDVWYYPKGFLPILHNICSPSVVTIHDTIVQHYSDRYPEWRNLFEYRYWEHMLKHTLTNADHILTVSHTSKRHIREFMARNGIEDKEIVVTYEPCLYEAIPQPENPVKGDYVLHLGSREPHKRTAWLIDLWLNENHKHWPMLHVVGTVPNDMEDAVSQSERIVKLPFLDDEALQAQFSAASALVFPSEIEGFGLPAIEAYYLGTPVCFVKGTSVEEVLEVATHKGGFHLDQPESLNQALEAVLAMPDDEIRRCGLKLRETYAAAKVVDRMMKVFAKAAGRSR